jgi:hypothetical protein
MEFMMTDQIVGLCRISKSMSHLSPGLRADNCMILVRGIPKGF